MVERNPYLTLALLFGLIAAGCASSPPVPPVEQSGPPTLTAEQIAAGMEPCMVCLTRFVEDLDAGRRLSPAAFLDRGGDAMVAYYACLSPVGDYRPKTPMCRKVAESANEIIGCLQGDVFDAKRCIFSRFD